MCTCARTHTHTDTRARALLPAPLGSPPGLKHFGGRRKHHIRQKSLVSCCTLLSTSTWSWCLAFGTVGIYLLACTVPSLSLVITSTKVNTQLPCPDPSDLLYCQPPRPHASKQAASGLSGPRCSQIVAKSTSIYSPLARNWSSGHT